VKQLASFICGFHLQPVIELAPFYDKCLNHAENDGLIQYKGVIWQSEPLFRCVE